MIEFSFIIPHYNTDRSLFQRCINSIPNDDTIQIIIVDDHSTTLYDKNNALIGNGIDIHRNNVEIHYLKENKGPGYARNYALNHAKGRWLLFCDADDIFETENLKRLLQLAKDTEYDIIYYAYDVVSKGKIEKKTFDNPFDDTVINTVNHKGRDLFVSSFYPWQKIVNKDFVTKNNLKFEQLYLSEDRLFALNSLILASSVGYFSAPVYKYYIHENSLVTTTPSLEKCIGAANVAIRINRILKRNKKDSIYRDKTSQRYLVYINKYSKITYWYFIAKEIVFLGWKFTMEDRKYICMCTGRKFNVLYQLTDQVRVLSGRILSK